MQAVSPNTVHQKCTKLLRSQYTEIIQRKFLSLFELDLREFGIK